MKLAACLALVAVLAGCAWGRQARPAPDPTTVSLSARADTCAAYLLHREGNWWVRADGAYRWGQLKDVLKTFKETKPLHGSIEGNRLVPGFLSIAAAGWLWYQIDEDFEKPREGGVFVGLVGLAAAYFTRQPTSTAEADAVRTYNEFLWAEYGLEGYPPPEKPRRVVPVIEKKQGRTWTP